MLGNILPPYHSLQELNLDWILTKVKDMLRFLPDDGSVGQILRRTAHGAEWSNEQGGGGGAVNSVNGQTGDVVLTAADVGALSDTTPIPDSTSDLINDSGFVDAAGAAAAAPVQSVAGKTGTVTLAKGDVGLGNVDNVQQYSASNPPPYPVTSVNGQTGAVVLTAADVGAAEANTSGTGYCKMPDGTLICYGMYTINNADWNTPTAAGNIYFTQVDPDVSFPYPFYSIPSVTTLSKDQSVPVARATATTTKINLVGIWRHTTSKPPTGDWQYVAVGRWKA